MKYNLRQPYPLNESLKSRLITCFLFGLFVFLFLFIFQPFELSKISRAIFPIALGYGMVCFAIMGILNLGIFSALPKYFSENNWTTKKEILWTFFNVLVIGLGNYVYSSLVKITDFSWKNLLLFEAFTIAVALFPVTISILLNQLRLSNKFERQSQQLNEEIEQNQNKYIPKSTSSKIVFCKDSTDELELEIESFIFAKSLDNYVEIYYINNGIVSRKTLRHTLKNILSLFSSQEHILKCHKSYIVNLKHVQRVSGNAQGYKLHIKNIETLIPVSRSLNDTIKLYFTDHH